LTAPPSRTRKRLVAALPSTALVPGLLEAGADHLPVLKRQTPFLRRDLQKALASPARRKTEQVISEGFYREMKGLEGRPPAR
jgi:hypothetical protein